MKAPPEPIDAGMKYVSVGPGSWTKSRPTASVTSSNQAGPPASSGAAPTSVGREEGPEQPIAPDITASRRAKSGGPTDRAAARQVDMRVVPAVSGASPKRSSNAS